MQKRTALDGPAAGLVRSHDRRRANGRGNCVGCGGVGGEVSPSAFLMPIAILSSAPCRSQLLLAESEPPPARRGAVRGAARSGPPLGHCGLRWRGETPPNWGGFFAMGAGLFFARRPSTPGAVSHLGLGLVRRGLFI